MITPEERAAAENALHNLEPLWRGQRREDSVRYNDETNWQKLVDYCNRECFGVVSGETLLVAFRVLLQAGQLTATPKPRLLLNAPFGSHSDDAARAAEIDKGVAETKATIQEGNDFQTFLRELTSVMSHEEYSRGGGKAWGATYFARKSGLEGLRAKWNGTFSTDLSSYEKRMSAAEEQNSHLAPGPVGHSGLNPTSTQHGGGSL